MELFGPPRDRDTQQLRKGIKIATAAARNQNPIGVKGFLKSSPDHFSGHQGGNSDTQDMNRIVEIRLHLFKRSTQLFLGQLSSEKQDVLRHDGTDPGQKKTTPEPYPGV